MSMQIKQQHIIFHIPMHIDRRLASASQIRPFKIIAAFESLGYHVDVVEGYGKERKASIRAIKQKIKAGIHYDFMYSESSVMPTQLTEKHHLPTYPCLDFAFFAFCKRHHIPIGLFYRDIHWCFMNKDRDWKQRVAKYFYRYDLRQYKKYVDVLFLPTMDMLQHIPFTFERPVVALPAGCDIHPLDKTEGQGQLRILYVGGMGEKYYFLPLLEAVKRLPFVHLTICCRKGDWAQVASTYEPYLALPNLSIVHQQGDELRTLYQQADLFSVLLEPIPYIQFAAPYKLFEAIGYQKPLLGSLGCWSGRFIAEQEVGIACPFSADKIAEALQQLHDNPTLLHNIENQVKKIAPLHTWESRAQQIAAALTPTV